MPKFLEDKLKKEYGADSSIPYKIMNRLGFMKGNKETVKGKEAERKHGSNPKIKGEMDKEKEVEAIKNKVFKKQYFMSSKHHAHGDGTPVKSMAQKYMSLKKG